MFCNSIWNDPIWWLLTDCDPINWSMKSLGCRECGCWARQWRSSSVFLGLILRRFVCKMSFYLLRVCLWFDPKFSFCEVVLAYAHCCLCVWMVVAVAGSGLTAPDNGPIKGLQSWSVSSAGVSVSARHVPVLKSNYRLSWNWALGTRDRNEHSRSFHNPKVSPFEN